MSRPTILRPGAWSTRLLAILGVALLALTLPVGSARAASIESSGPLTKVEISPDLNCDVRYEGDLAGEWYGDIACGTFVAVGDELFGPQRVPAGSNVTGADGYTAFTPVSQTGPTGDGTAASPFTITTTVTLGSTGISLTQVDSYQAGQDSYRTVISLSGAQTTARVYRGGDCYLQDSDRGLGAVLQGGAPVCKAQPGSTNPERVEGFLPLTSGSTYLEGHYSDVWEAIGTKQALPNTCECDSLVDNGIAISWPASVPATGSVSFASLTFFSPVGTTPVTFGKTVDQAEVGPGALVTYTVTVSNPSVREQVLSSIVDSLPQGFGYVAGSTTGVTTDDPVVGDDGALTWSGRLVVPAGSASDPGVATLTFQATASDVVGSYANSVTGAGEGVTVVAAQDVAVVTVTAAPTSTSTTSTSPTSSTSTTTSSTSTTSTTSSTSTETTTSSSTTSPSTTSSTMTSSPTSTSTPTSTTTTPVSTTTASTPPSGPRTPDVVQTDGGPGEGSTLAAGGILAALLVAGLLVLRPRTARRH